MRAERPSTTSHDDPIASAPRAVALFLVAAVLVTIAVLPSCSGLPDNTCFGDRVNALTVDGGGLEGRCTTCVQASCCDEVGRCQDDATCIDTFKAAHRCVIEQGSGGESACIDRLGASDTRGRRLYDCMRSKCGGPVAGDAACGISSCNVDPSVVLLASASCDRCLGGSCCREINSCYADRRCKLAVECIVRDCRLTLGSDMAALEVLGLAEIQATQRAVCTNQVVGDITAGGECIQDCLVRFAPFSGTADDANARCRAFGIFACGAAAKCAGSCGPDDAGTTDAGGEGAGDASDASAN